MAVRRAVNRTELFNVPNGRQIINHVMLLDRYKFNLLRQQHLRVPLTTYEEFDRFRETLTFFRAVSAPEGLDDVFGDPYSESRNLYVLAAPNKPDEIIFYSSAELIQTFLFYNDFSDPKDPKKTLHRSAGCTSSLSDQSRRRYPCRDDRAN